MDNREKIIQYKFTAYLLKSIKNQKKRYIIKKNLRQKHETLVENISEFIPEQQNTNIFLDDIQNTSLEKALDNLKTLHLKILELHIFDGYSLKEISTLLSLNYNTVLSIYSRTIKKIKAEMENTSDEF